MKIILSRAKIRFCSLYNANQPNSLLTGTMANLCPCTEKGFRSKSWKTKMFTQHLATILARVKTVYYSGALWYNVHGFNMRNRIVLDHYTCSKVKCFPTKDISYLQLFILSVIRTLQQCRVKNKSPCPQLNSNPTNVRPATLFTEDKMLHTNGITFSFS